MIPLPEEAQALYEHVLELAQHEPLRPDDYIFLDSADAVLDEPCGLIPDDAPTTRDVMGPGDRGRRA